MDISLYKKIDTNLLEAAGFEISTPKFSYTDEQDNSERTFESSELTTEYILNDIDSEWSPIEDNLILRQDITINHPERVFGFDGLTNSLNKLGLACYIYSKTANFQETLHVSDIESQSTPLNISFETIFEANTLGGILFVEYYVYLKELRVEEPFKANVVGINLMEDSLLRYSVIIDGTGSEFPIEEINDLTQPLWSLQIQWTDPFEDLFNMSSVRLILNQAHPLFKQLMNQRNRINQYLMNDIIINAMAMMIQHSILINKDEFTEDTEYQPGTVAQIIWYWISTYEVKTGSLDEITNSLRAKTDPFIEEE